MSENNPKATFGLEAQGHLPTIEKILARWNSNRFGIDMTFSSVVWEEIGRTIRWEPFTAALSYFEYLNKNQENTKLKEYHSRLTEVLETTGQLTKEDLGICLAFVDEELFETANNQDNAQ